MDPTTQLLRRWTLVGILLLGNLALLAFIAVFIYAQIKIRPLMGAGPSVSEFLDPYVNAIFQLTLVGVAGLLLTHAYWRFTVLAKRVDHEGWRPSSGFIIISLVLVPIWLMFIYYIGKVYIPQWL